MAEHRILIVDDDADLVEGLRWYLEAEGFRVGTAADGEAALEAFAREPADLVVLDIMMPGLDGVEACRRIREKSDAFIVMLSARDAEIDKVRALSEGADDYVTKPFHASELIARIRAHLRRSGTAAAPASSAATALRWEGLEVFEEARRATANGVDIPLTTTEFDLLATLMRRPHFVFTRDRLVEILWREEAYGDSRLVDNHVYRLREKLDRAGLPTCPIATIRGVGYAFRPEA